MAYKNPNQQLIIGGVFLGGSLPRADQQLDAIDKINEWPSIPWSIRLGATRTRARGRDLLT